MLNSEEKFSLPTLQLLPKLYVPVYLILIALFTYNFLQAQAPFKANYYWEYLTVFTIVPVILSLYVLLKNLQFDGLIKNKKVLPTGDTHQILSYIYYLYPFFGNFLFGLLLFFTQAVFKLNAEATGTYLQFFQILLLGLLGFANSANYLSLIFGAFNYVFWQQVDKYNKVQTDSEIIVSPVTF